ncbi:hypothetical protein DPMN_006940 [Dreissena polymorpha]|uniref:Uncharacterized protein n=1 Tax=Dreissena polymorpha TaxID=45954 RepID=A0A9D4RY88_DREPO|nr:hypothetical protein DPMN_006940 [Dreissena polymorpha]
MTSEHPGSHVFQQTTTIFIHIHDIIQTNILTKKNAPPPGGHVFQATGTIFELVQDIIRTNLLAKFHDDRTINMGSRVLTRFNYSYITKNAMPPWWPYINGTNLVTKFHDDRTINVVSRVLIRKMPGPLDPGGHVFKATETNFKLIQEIIGTNLLTKFHEDRKIKVASKVFTRFYYSHIGKNAPPPGGHVF